MLGFNISNNNIEGVETTKGIIKSKKVAIVVAGQSSHLADMLGVRLPITTFPLQAWVSEPIKPCLPSMVASMDYQFYVCLLYTSPSPRDKRQSRMPSSA